MPDFKSFCSSYCHINHSRWSKWRHGWNLFLKTQSAWQLHCSSQCNYAALLEIYRRYYTRIWLLLTLQSTKYSLTASFLYDSNDSVLIWTLQWDVCMCPIMKTFVFGLLTGSSNYPPKLVWERRFTFISIYVWKLYFMFISSVSVVFKRLTSSPPTSSRDNNWG